MPARRGCASKYGRAVVPQLEFGALGGSSARPVRAACHPRRSDTITIRVAQITREITARDKRKNVIGTKMNIKFIRNSLPLNRGGL